MPNITFQFEPSGISKDLKRALDAEERMSALYSSGPYHQDIINLKQTRNPFQRTLPYDDPYYRCVTEEKEHAHKY